TAYAILPRRPSLNLAILAVAYLDNHDEAFLVLYNAESGEPLRQLTGHLTQINSLAFSANGKLLASTAEDQVVCIWGVVDLDQILGKHGRLVGVAVEQRPNNDLVVADVAEDSPLRRKVHQGDMIEGMFDGDNLDRLDSPQVFYSAIFYRTKPGEQVALRIN